MTWSDFYRATTGRAPRDLFLHALAEFQTDGLFDTENMDAQKAPFAIDLGCGDGTETLHLLRAGWRVLAIDGGQGGLDLLLARVPKADRPRLATEAARFAQAELPSADFIYAGFSLFFQRPQEFPSVWARVVAAVRVGGRLAAHFLGPHDTWAQDPAMTSHDAAVVRRLFTGFELEVFDEREDDRPAVSGPKHWHVFEVIARKQ